MMKLSKHGQSLVELLLAIGLSGILLPALLTGLVTTRQGKPQQDQRMQATALLSTTEEAVRSIRNRGWVNIVPTGTYHPIISGTQWVLAPSPAPTDANGLSNSITISDVYRSSGAIVVSPTPGTLDPSTKKVDFSVTWTQPYASSIQSTMYFTRYRDNLAYIQTTQNDFLTPTPGISPAILTNNAVVNNFGGEVQLANNNKAKWCSPAFSPATIDLPDGPPVAVAATASLSQLLFPMMCL